MRSAWFALALSVVACHAPIPRYNVSYRGDDSDNDGAADIDDACPNDAEDGLPPRANDGCPAEDSDRDGVGRDEDACPNAKEDGMPPHVADGCPGDDDDRDGVADEVDQCAQSHEDNLGDKPNDGCPAADTDDDGLADVVDRCPAEPETHNAFRDDDGCPDTAPHDGIVFDRETSSIFIPEDQRVRFARGSATLDARANRTIADIAEVLRAHPEIERLEIEGHASSVGDSAVNLSLTEQRAVAVARALESRGIAGRRLVPIGYGEMCPAIDRGDEEDVADNRRVLFKCVVVSGKWQPISRGCWRARAGGVDATQRKPGVPGLPPKADDKVGGV